MNLPVLSNRRQILTALALIFCGALIAFNLGLTWSTAKQFAAHTAPEPRLIIDGNNFIREAGRMVKRKRAFFTQNFYLSTGMEVWVAAAWRIAGFRKLGLFVKRVNVLLFAAIIVLTGLFGFLLKKNLAQAFLLAALVSCSHALQTYCVMFQYEVPLALLLLLLVFFLWISPTKFRLFKAGFVITLCCIVRPHFLVLLPLAAVFLVWKKRGSSLSRAKSLGWLSMGFFSLALPWNILYSYKLHAFYFFYLWDYGYPIHRSLNAATVGYNYPFNEISGPSGLSFITHAPFEYLKLLGRRFLFLTGIKTDIWFVSPWPSIWLAKITKLPKEFFFGIISLVGTLAVLIGTFRMALRNPTAGWLLLIPVVACLLPQLILNSSTRFVVPLIPLFILLQWFAIVPNDKRNPTLHEN